MKDMMAYKGYYGSVHYSDEDLIFHGKLEYIRSLISYEGKDVKSLRKAFKEAVDDYVKLCEEEGKRPEQPFKGTFNVRTGSDPLYARENGSNLNTVVTEALEKYLSA